MPASTDSFEDLLRQMTAILDSSGLSQLAGSFRCLSDAVAHASPQTRSDVARELLRMYQGGMGGFDDLVMQDADGVLPEHDEFDRIRTRLFEAALRELR